MTTRLSLDPALHVALRGALALLFLQTAVHKLRDAVTFARAVRDYDLVPARWAAGMSRLLVAVETLVGLGLLLPVPGRGPALAATGVLTVYTGAIAINLLRGRRNIDCGCGGGAAPGQLLAPALVGRNALLVGGAAAVALPPASRALVWIDFVTVGACLAAFGLLYAATDQVLATAPRLAALRRDAAHGESAASVEGSDG